MAIAKNDRICVVGAGPAGLATAHRLHASGYHHLTVLERMPAPGCMAVLAEMCAKAGAIEECFAYAELGDAMAQGSPSLELRAVQPLLTVIVRRGDEPSAHALLESVVAKFPVHARGVDLDQARADVSAAALAP